jgi:hypothetical protein
MLPTSLASIWQINKFTNQPNVLKRNLVYLLKSTSVSKTIMIYIQVLNPQVICDFRSIKMMNPENEITLLKETKIKSMIQNQTKIALTKGLLGLHQLMNLLEINLR